VNVVLATPVTILVPDFEVALARRWADAIKNGGHLHKPQFDYRDDTFFYGYIGELATRRWLLREGILHRFIVHLDGTSAPPEFTVWCQGQPKKLEVKNASQAHHQWFLVGLNQDLDGEVFIGTRIQAMSPCVVSVMGWLRHAEVDQLPIGDLGHGPARQKRFEQMHDVAKLLPRLDRVLQVIG